MEQQSPRQVTEAGKLLRIWRINNNITGEEFATQIGIGHGYLSALELGDKRWPLVRLAQVADKLGPTLGAKLIALVLKAEDAEIEAQRQARREELAKQVAELRSRGGSNG